MLEAMNMRQTEMLGDAIEEEAKRVDSQAENRELMKQLDDGTTGVSQHVFDQMKKDYESRLKSADRQHTWNTKRVEDLKDAIEYSEEEHETELGTLKTEADAVVEKVNTENAALRKEVKRLISCHETVRGELKNEKNKTADLENTMESLKQEHEKLDSGHSREIFGLQRDLEWTRKSSKTTEATLEQCEKANKDLRDAATLRVDEQKVQQDLKAKDAQINQLKTEIRTKQGQHDTRVKVINNLTLKIKDLEEETAKLSILQDIMPTLNEKIKTLNETIRQNKDDIKDLKFQLERSTILQEGELKAKVDNDARLIQDARHERDTFAANVKKLQKVVRQNERTIQGLRYEVGTLTIKIEELEADEKAAQSDIEKCKTDCVAEKARLQKDFDTRKKAYKESYETKFE